MDSFYCLPPAVAFIITFAAIMIFGAASALIGLKSEKTARFICLAVLIAYTAFILNLTLFSRSVRAEGEVYLTPFYTFAMAKENPEIYRSMLMNIYLFMPFGAALSCAAGGGCVRKIIAAAAFAAVLSPAVECAQYFYVLGCAQTDDVICNVLGALVGCTALVPRAAVKKLADSRKSERTVKNKDAG